MNLRERIEAAIKRITDGLGPMRIPADQTDPDLVLRDCQRALDELSERLKACDEAIAIESQRFTETTKLVADANDDRERLRNQVASLFAGEAIFIDTIAMLTRRAWRVVRCAPNSDGEITYNVARELPERYESNDGRSSPLYEHHGNGGFTKHEAYEAAAKLNARMKYEVRQFFPGINDALLPHEGGPDVDS